MARQRHAQAPSRTRRPAARRRRRDWWFLLAAVPLAIPAVVWAAVRLGDDGVPSAGLSADDPGVAHVHGLGVNPADGSLHVATHHGMFRIADGERAERVGQRFQDTMGFTVAGADHFLGSGHPDLEAMRDGDPPLLGLIESTDAGRSWEAVSLSGQADFHGLASAHGNVYGWDATSGRFMVSSDGTTWSTRSTRPLSSFAVDPADPDHVVAADDEGLIDSADGGRNWRRMDGPVVRALSWEETAGLIGVEPDGTVHRSTDGGATWSEVGQLEGSPQALHAAESAWYAAVEDSAGGAAIHRSDDAGASWDLLYQQAD